MEFIYQGVKKQLNYVMNRKEKTIITKGYTSIIMAFLWKYIQGDKVISLWELIKFIG